MNTNSTVDLHTHSYYSDGTYSPEEIVKEAFENKLSAVALTDHDCLKGLDEFNDAGKKYNVNTINGIELAAYYESPFIDKKKEIHIVGLFIDNKNVALNKKTDLILQQRIERNKKMVKRLTELGFPMTYEELKAIAKKGSCSRTHYAVLMVKKGYVKTKDEAFDKYFSAGMPGYVPRILPTPEECIQLIKNAKGVPILAHPTLYRIDIEKIELMAKDLRDKGIEGIEVMYSSYNSRQQYEITNIANKYNFAKSGGSDFHGLNKSGIYLAKGNGNLSVPDYFLDELKSRRNKNV